MCSPFLVAHAVCFFECDFSVDTYKNRSSEKVMGGFGADVCILLLE